MGHIQSKLTMYHANGSEKYECIIYSNGFIYECTYSEDGNILTCKNSNGIYGIKGIEVTKQEYEAFINSTSKYTMQELLCILDQKSKIKLQS